MARGSQVNLHAGIGMDTRDFARFAKALRKAAPELARQLRAGLRAAGELVAVDARARAEEASVTIPPSIKVRVSAATVSVVAGGGNVVLAGLMEIGNKGSGGGSTFRHPYWGEWVADAKPQAMHPYLLPAVQEHVADAEAAAVEALDAAIAIATLDPGE